MSSSVPPPAPTGPRPGDLVLPTDEPSTGKGTKGRRNRFAAIGLSLTVAIVGIGVGVNAIGGDDEAEQGSVVFREWKVNVNAGTAGSGQSLTADGREYVIGDDSDAEARRLFVLRST